MSNSWLAFPMELTKFFVKLASSEVFNEYRLPFCGQSLELNLLPQFTLQFQHHLVLKPRLYFPQKDRSPQHLYSSQHLTQTLLLHLNFNLHQKKAENLSLPSFPPFFIKSKNSLIKMIWLCPIAYF